MKARLNQHPFPRSAPQTPSGFRITAQSLAFCLLAVCLAPNAIAQKSQADPLPATSVDQAAVSKLAATLAAALANNETRQKFNTEPFSAIKGQAILRGTRWEWRASAGYGKGDLQAIVSFREDGSEPKVHIQTLVNEGGRSSVR
jgi:hypothetical protein